MTLNLMSFTKIHRAIRTKTSLLELVVLRVQRPKIYRGVESMRALHPTKQMVKRQRHSPLERMFVITYRLCLELGCKTRYTR
jgi:hypothetical protein